MIKKIIYSLLVIILIVEIFLYVDRKINFNYNNKFENTKSKCSYKNIMNNWGEPNSLYVTKGEVWLIYKKDLLGSYSFVFVFDDKDSVLLRKAIDD